MSLERFKLPAPESRLFIHKGTIYKLKLSYKYSASNNSAFLPCRPSTMQLEVEHVLRAVLHEDNKLQPLKQQTKHFLVDCEFVPWAMAKKLLFEDRGQKVRIPAHDHMIVVTVQPNSQEEKKYGETKKDQAFRKATQQKSMPKPKSSHEDSLVIPETPEKPDADMMRKIIQKNNLRGDSAQKTGRRVVPETPVEPSTSGIKVIAEKERLSRSTRSRSVTKKLHSTRQDSVRSRVVKRRQQLLAKAIENIGDESSDEDMRESASQETAENDARAEIENDMGMDDNDDAYEAEPVLAVRRSARRAKLRDKFTNIPSEDSNSAGSRRSKRLQEITEQASPQAKRMKGSPINQHKSSTPYKTRSKSVQKSPSASPVKRSMRSTSLLNDHRRTNKRTRSNSVQCDGMMSTRIIRFDKNEKTHPCDKSVSIGTQTQSSTYRIKASQLGKLKQLVVPLERVDSKGKQTVDSKAKQTGSQSQIVFKHSPDLDETGISMRSTTQETQCYTRDRASIQQEELEEEMKLQQMALTSSAKRVASKSTSHAQQVKSTAHAQLVKSTVQGLPAASNLKRRSLNDKTVGSPPKKRRSFLQAAWDGLTTPFKKWWS